MDAFEATQILMSRIQTLDPENSTRIMGVILLQDKGEKEMMKLALGNDALLLSCINHAKTILGLAPSLNPATTVSTSFGVNNHPFSHSSPGVLIPNNGYHSNNPSSPAASLISSPKPISYADVVNGSNPSGSNVSGSTSLNLYLGNDFGEEVLSTGDIAVQHQVQDRLFLDDSMADPVMSPSGRSDSLVYPYGEDVNGIPSPHPHPFHRRSCSVNDTSFIANMDEGGWGSGFGWRHCMYFARGFCKNGSACRFMHSDVGGSGEAIEVGSPSPTLSGFDELLRMKALQKQKFALMSSGGHRPFAFNKCTNLLNDNQRCGLERPEFSTMRLSAGASSISRQIYLTFPADSTFEEEDVSNYFSTFGLVQDVRIPYQQKRMFGFVTFVYPETVKVILAKGNPHFVCNSRVLVKPYKEKGKGLDKKFQHMEIGEYAACLSPSELDSRDHFDIPYGPRMLLNSQESMLRRQLKQEVELQNAMELQARRMMNIQLKDLKNQLHMKHLMPNMLSGLSIFPPRLSQSMIKSYIIASDSLNLEVSEEFESGHQSPEYHFPTDDFNLVPEGARSLINTKFDNVMKKEPIKEDHSDLFESVGYSLPDNLFSSPTKFSAEKQSVFFHDLTEADDSVPATNTSSNITPVLTGSSSLSTASREQCYFRMPSH